MQCREKSSKPTYVPLPSLWTPLKRHIQERTEEWIECTELTPDRESSATYADIIPPSSQYLTVMQQPNTRMTSSSISLEMTRVGCHYRQLNSRTFEDIRSASWATTFSSSEVTEYENLPQRPRHYMTPMTRSCALLGVDYIQSRDKPLNSQTSEDNHSTTSYVCGPANLVFNS